MYSRGLPSFIYVRISFLRGENLVYLGDLFHGHARTWFLVLTISAPPGPKKNDLLQILLVSQTKNLHCRASCDFSKCIKTVS